MLREHQHFISFNRIGNRFIQSISFLLVFFVLGSSISFGQELKPYFQSYNTKTHTLVFIPGILGSSINVEGEEVWGGNNFNSPELLYSETGPIPETAPLDRVTISKLFEAGRIVYGEFLNEFSEKFKESGGFVPLSYDWRASNKTSAASIADKICDAKLEEKRGIIFVAHSMGGLVLKHWLKNHYEQGCNGTKLNIKKILYVATPHLGAAKALWGLIDQPSLTWIPVVDRYVSKGLERYGPTFPSVYELFPAELAYRGDFENFEPCIDISLANQIGRPSFYQRNSKNELISFDIFNADRWEEIGVIQRISNSLGDDYSKVFFASMLEDARQTICEIANYIAPDELSDRVVIFSGQTSDNSGRDTLTSISLFVGNSTTATDKTVRNGRKRYNFTLSMGKGDQTVALFSGRMGRCISNCGVRPITANHENILNTDFFREFLEEVSIATEENSDRRRNLLRQYAKTNIENGRVSFGYGLDKQAAPEWPLILQAERKNYAIENYGPLETAYTSARDSNDVNALIAIAQNSQTNDLLRAWSFTNAGYEQLKSGDFDAALETFGKALTATQSELILKPKDKTEIVGKLQNNIGWANVKLGNPREAEMWFNRAKQSGNELAINGLRETRKDIRNAGLYTQMLAPDLM